MFERFKKQSAVHRLLEEQLYEKVAQELANGQRRDGLWVKAIANSNGSDEKAKALYIQYRVQSIKDEIEIAKTLVEEAESPVRTEKQAKAASTEDRGGGVSGSKKRPLKGQHHWSDDYRTHKKTAICPKCGDIHHGKGFRKCEKCGGNLIPN